MIMPPDYIHVNLVFEMPFNRILIFIAISASIHSNELTTEEMRQLLERNEVVNPNGANAVGNLQPFDTMNI